MTTTLIDVRIPADQFPLGRILQEYPDVTIELERLVPTGSAIIPLFWVGSHAGSAVERTLEEDPLVDDITRLSQLPDRILYSINWSRDVNSLVGAIVDGGVEVLSAEGTADAWEFRLQFRSSDQLSEFRRDCRDADIDLDLLRVYHPTVPPQGGSLTSEQTHALATAYDNGYWDVPRGITQSDLADLVGISDNSMSQRLRRGVRVAVAELLYGDDGGRSE
jgi:predicted DNA binding protein